MPVEDPEAPKQEEGAAEADRTADSLWDGDAAIAAPLDAPAPPRRGSVNDFGAIFGEVTPGLPSVDQNTEVMIPVFSEELAFRVTDPAPAPAQSPIDEAILAAFGREEVVRRAPPPASASGVRRPPPRPGSRSRDRDYPAMKGLLKNPDAMPRVIERAVEARAFIRRSPQPPRPKDRGAREELDGMLEEMAEGLLVGGDGGQLSEMRVTLRDDFFNGTELRIGVGPDGIRARFIPPDRATYRHLSSEIPRLHAHLADRGLRVGKLEIDEPE